jgi:hypothetical protein
MKKFPKILAFLALIVFVAACDTAQVQSLDELLNEDGKTDSVDVPDNVTPTDVPATVTPTVVYEDVDGDGYSNKIDCDDKNIDVHPGAEEVCNNVDDNCDGDTDEGLTVTVYPDADQDGFGSEEGVVEGCADKVPEKGYVSRGGDCNDSALDEDGDGKVDGFFIHSDVTEVCDDGVDNNCDGETDEGCKAPEPTLPKFEGQFGIVVAFADDATRTMSAQEYYSEAELGKWWNIEGLVSYGSVVSVPVTSKDACGARFNVATGNPASQWLCYGNGDTAVLDPTAIVYAVINGTWYDVTKQVTKWSAPNPKDGCSAKLQWNTCK